MPTSSRNAASAQGTLPAPVQPTSGSRKLHGYKRANGALLVWHLIRCVALALLALADHNSVAQQPSSVDSLYGADQQQPLGLASGAQGHSSRIQPPTESAHPHVPRCAQAANPVLQHPPAQPLHTDRQCGSAKLCLALPTDAAHAKHPALDRRRTSQLSLRVGATFHASTNICAPDFMV